MGDVVEVVAPVKVEQHLRHYKTFYIQSINLGLKTEVQTYLKISVCPAYAPNWQMPTKCQIVRAPFPDIISLLDAVSCMNYYIIE